MTETSRPSISLLYLIHLRCGTSPDRITNMHVSRLQCQITHTSTLIICEAAYKHQNATVFSWSVTFYLYSPGGALINGYWVFLDKYQVSVKAASQQS